MRTSSSPSEYVPSVHRNIGAHTAIPAIAIERRQDSPKTERETSAAIMPNSAASMKRAGMAASSGSPRNNSECHASTKCTRGAAQVIEGRKIDGCRAEGEQVASHIART